MARLLEEPRALRLGLAQLGRRLRVRARDDLVRLLLGRGENLLPLPLRLVAIALDVRLLRLELALAPPDLLLRARELRGRGALRVALERVRELRRRADEVERVRADGVAGRLDVRRLAGRLDHA